MVYAFGLYYDVLMGNTNDEKEHENLHGEYGQYYGEEEEVEGDEGDDNIEMVKIATRIV